MKKIILGAFLMILAGASAISAQIMKPSVTINRDKASIIRRLPGKIQTFVPQIRLPQPDSANKNTAMSGHSLSSNFILSPDNIKVDGKGQIDFFGAALIASTGSAMNPYSTPIAIIEGAGNSSSNLANFGVDNSAVLTIKNTTAGSLYLVDCNVYATSITANSGQPQTLIPNANGHIYFVLTAGSNDDVVAMISSPNPMWALFSADISKLN